MFSHPKPRGGKRICLSISEKLWITYFRMNNHMFPNSVLSFAFVFAKAAIQRQMLNFIVFFQLFWSQKLHVAFFTLVIENVILFAMPQKGLNILAFFVASLTIKMNSLKVTFQSDFALKLQLTKLARIHIFLHFSRLGETERRLGMVRWIFDFLAILTG